MRPRWTGAGPAQADPAGTGELAHAVRAHELLEGVELLGTPDDLERDRLAADVGDAGAEDLAERDQLGALVGRGADGDQRQLALDRLLRARSSTTRSTLTSLCICFSICSSECSEQSTRSVSREMSGRSVGPDREALDVVAAPREHLRHARERARLVLELDGDGVVTHPRHQAPYSRSSALLVGQLDACPPRPRRRAPSGSSSRPGRRARRRRRCGRSRAPPRASRRGRPRCRP